MINDLYYFVSISWSKIPTNFKKMTKDASQVKGLFCLFIEDDSLFSRGKIIRITENLKALFGIELALSFSVKKRAL